MLCFWSSLFFILISFPVQAQISHLELGAANYRARDGQSEKRFEILELTVLDLIESHGPHGVIYLNDKCKSGLKLAADHLTRWLTKNGLINISIDLVPGNYMKIDLPKVRTAHLSNPGRDQLPVLRNSYFSRKKNARLVRRLEQIAILSEAGLKITSYFTEGKEAYVPRIGDFTQNTILTKLSSEGYEYNLPDGDDWRTAFNESFETDHTSTFLLVSKDRACLNLLSAQGSLR